MAKGSVPRIVIDGLVFHSDGNSEPLRTGGVTAANFTVAPYLEGFQSACDSMSRWRAMAERGDSGWKLVLRAADIRAAQEEGKTGLIMGWQNLWPIELNLDRLAGFHALGLRVAQLTYNDANFVADGCGEERNGGRAGVCRRGGTERPQPRVAVEVSPRSLRTRQ